MSNLGFSTFRQIRNIMDKVKEERYLYPTRGINRVQMPQIAGDEQERFLEWCSNQQITLFKKKVIPSQLKATQSNFNLRKVANMIDNGIVESADQVIYVSQDGYVLDGHHRWLSYYANHDAPLNAVELPYNVHDCLVLMLKFTGLNDSQIEKQLAYT